MTKLKWAAFIGAIFFLNACQTYGGTGAGPLELSDDLEKSYGGYLLAIYSSLGPPARLNPNLRSVFVVDPETKETGFGMHLMQHSSYETVLALAKESCHEGCLVFDVNGEIIWSGFPHTDKYENKAVATINNYQLQN